MARSSFRHEVTRTVASKILGLPTTREIWNVSRYEIELPCEVIRQLVLGRRISAKDQVAGSMASAGDGSAVELSEISSHSTSSNDR